MDNGHTTQLLFLFEIHPVNWNKYASKSNNSFYAISQLLYTYTINIDIKESKKDKLNCLQSGKQKNIFTFTIQYWITAIDS